MNAINITLLLVSFLAGGILSAFLFKRFAVRKQIQENVDKTFRSLQLGVVGQYYPRFSDDIRTISPTFDKLYEQALIAENEKLNLACGIAFGKSLEFLIKDYAIHQNPSEAETIKKAALAKCVKDYLRDDSLKNCSELAVWLRNDQTHYVKRFDNADVKELKQLIQLITKLIDVEFDKHRTNQKIAALRNAITNTDGKDPND